jgi:hypothetical protein
MPPRMRENRQQRVVARSRNNLTKLTKLTPCQAPGLKIFQHKSAPCAEWAKLTLSRPQNMRGSGMRPSACRTTMGKNHFCVTSRTAVGNRYGFAFGSRPLERQWPVWGRLQLSPLPLRERVGRGVRSEAPALPLSTATRQQAAKSPYLSRKGREHCGCYGVVSRAAAFFQKHGQAAVFQDEAPCGG